MSEQLIIKRKPMWLYFLGGVVALIVVLYLVIGSGFFLRSVVLPKVGRQLNCDITADDASFSPLSSLTLRGVKVVPKGDEPLFTAREVRVRYGLFAILGGNLRVDEVTLDGPQFTLVERAPGDSNLSRLKSSSAPKNEPAGPSKTPQIDIRNVTIKDGLVRSTTKSEVVEIAGLNLTLDQLRNGGSGKLTLSGGPRLTRGADRATLAFKGSYDLSLTADLQPAGVKGGIEFSVTEAAGAFKEFAQVAAILQTDMAPTEIRDLTLSFRQAGQAFGSLRLSGPFDLNKKEARLSYDIQSIDRRVLGLVGAAQGIDFGSTTVSGKGNVDMTQLGQLVASKGRIAADRFTLALTNGTTPTLDLALEYQVSANLNDKTALLQRVDLSARQGDRSVLAGGLDRPMNLAWGENSPGFRESTFNLSLTNLSLADWKSFLGPEPISGRLGLGLKIQAERDGRLLQFDLVGGVEDLAASAASNRIDRARLSFSTKGKLDDFKALRVDAYGVQVTRAGQDLLGVSGSATANFAGKDLGVQTAVEADLPGLATTFPAIGLESSAGKLKVTGQFFQKADTTNAAASVNLKGLTGRFGDMQFQDYSATLQATIDVKENELIVQRATVSGGSGFAQGGSLDFDGRYHLGKKSGRFGFKSAGMSQSALGPFVAAALRPKELKSVALDLSGEATFTGQDQANIKTSVKVSKLVVDDPTGRLPKTPLSASLTLEAGMQGKVIEVKQGLLALEPTPRAKNELVLTGRLDLGTNQPTPSTLSLKSDGLDLTAFYDLFAGQPAARPEAAATPATPKPVAPAADPNREPDPIVLPIRKLDAEINLARVYLRDVAVTNLLLKAAVDQGNVSVNPLSMNLNGAPVSAGLTANVGVPGFQYDVKFDADQVPVTPFAKSFATGEKVVLNGTVTAKGQVKGAGVTGPNLRRNLGGNFNVVATNLDYQVTIAKSRFVKILTTVLTTVVRLPSLSESPIQTVVAQGTIGTGNVELTDIRALSPAFTATTRGRIELNDVLTNSPVNLPVSLALNRNGKSEPLPDFLTIVGTVGAPKSKIDPLGVAKLGMILPGSTNLLGSAVTAVTNTVNKLTGGALGNLLGSRTNTGTSANNPAGILGGLFGGRTAPATNPAAPATVNPAAPAGSTPPKTGNPLDGLRNLLPPADPAKPADPNKKP